MIERTLLLAGAFVALLVAATASGFVSYASGYSDGTKSGYASGLAANPACQRLSVWATWTVNVERDLVKSKLDTSRTGFAVDESVDAAQHYICKVIAPSVPKNPYLPPVSK